MPSEPPHKESWSRLTRLLHELFSPEELWTSLKLWDAVEGASDLPDFETKEKAWYAVVTTEWLQRRGLIDAEFFDFLLSLRPKCKAEILAAAKAGGCPVADPDVVYDLVGHIDPQVFQYYMRQKNAWLKSSPVGLTQPMRDFLGSIRRELNRPETPESGTQLSNRFTLAEMMGRGGFGTVWSAIDGNDSSRVAVKILYSHWEKTENLARFLRGFSQMKLLTHPNVVRVLYGPSRDLQTGFIYAVMELVDGPGNLSAVAINDLVPIPQRLEIVLQVADVLRHAHARGLIHRDIKPENILIRPDFSAAVTDFDLVWTADSVHATTSIYGSPLFSAPELPSYTELTAEERPRVDVYSVGMLALFAIDANSLRLIHGRTLSETVANLPCHPDLKAVISRAIRPYYERYATIGELVDDLRAVLHDGSPPRGITTKRQDFEEYVVVPPCTNPPYVFEMGSPDSESERQPDETPHSVLIPRPLWVKVAPVTQYEWEKLMGNNPSGHWSAPRAFSRPVENVNWFDAIAYCNELSSREGLEPAYIIENRRGAPGRVGFQADVRWKGPDSEGYRLPTEAEWEFACRAGTEGQRYSELSKVAWYKDNAEYETHSVMTLDPNPWGLFDMLGNVWEWCWDCYGAYPSQGLPTAWIQPHESNRRVIRGGAWNYEAWICRAAARYDDAPNLRNLVIGFRVVRTCIR